MRSKTLIAVALASALVGVACSSETVTPAPPSPTTEAPTTAAPTMPPIEVIPGPVETVLSDYGPNIDGSTNAFDAPVSPAPPVDVVSAWVTGVTIPPESLRATLAADDMADSWGAFVLRGQPDGPFTVTGKRLLGLGGAVDEVQVLSASGETFVFVFDAGGLVVAASLEAAPTPEESR